MDTRLTPADVEVLDTLPLADFFELLRTWRNHWAEVRRITADFPEDIKKVLALRPIDPHEALEQTRAQFAVLFHPDAAAGFVQFCDAAMRTIEALLEERGREPDSGTRGRR